MRRQLAWSVGLACLGLAAHPAGAATDKIVVDEFLLRCADARPDGAFVELVAAGPGQTFDAALGVRLLNPSGATLSDLPGVFASRAGQPWPEGQHFLIATAAFEPLTGVAPDAMFDTPPNSARGGIVLYRAVGTTIQVLSRVEYSTSSTLARTPPAGRSSFRVVTDLYRWSHDPSPTRSDDVLARAPDCFADPHRPIRITELATMCGGGSPSGGFVEIAPTADNQAMDGDLALRALDHTGARLFDVSLGFGTLEGSPWPISTPSASRAWLVGDSSLKSPFGDPPDRVWPAPLDTVGGRLVLHGRDVTGAEVVLSELEYGSAALPAPPAGASLVWDAFTVRYVQRSPSTPTSFAGRAHASQDCVAPSSVRIRELLTSCTLDGDESYVELTATGNGEQRDSTLSIEIHDRTDALTAVVPAGFGDRAGTSWPPNTSWLFATGGISNDLYTLGDARLPFPLDPVAGRIDVLRRVGGRVEVIQSLRWGGTQLAPPPGQALRRETDTRYVLSTTAQPPAPRASNGQVLRCPVPPDTSIAFAVRGIEVCTGCQDGSRRGQYVQLILFPGVNLDTSFVLRLYDRSGTLLGTRQRLFASASPRRPTEERSWLMTSADFPEPDLRIDAVLPAALDTLAGTVEVVSVRGGLERARTVLSYGGAPYGPVPRGYSFRTHPAMGFGYAAPTSFNRITTSLPGCLFSSSSWSGPVRIGEVFLACSNRDSSMQYVEVAGVNPNLPADPRLSLRVLDASGTLRQSLPNLLPTSLPPGPPGAERTLLIGGPAFEGATGLAPDRTLDQPIQVAAGRLEVHFEDPVVGEQRSEKGVTFLPGTAMPLGRSLVISSSGGQVTSREPVAIRLSGDAFAIPATCQDTSVAVPMLLQKLALGCFDGDPRGQIIQLVASGSEESLTSAFALRAYDHAGAFIGEVYPAFGSRSGSGGSSRSLLIARVDAPLPVPLDAPLGFALDTLGGTLELVERLPARDRLAWSRAYPASDPRGFVMGSVRQLVAETSWFPGSSQLANWSNQKGYLLGCHYGTPASSAVQVRSLFGACGDGTLGPSWVELAPTSATSVLAGLELLITDEQTSIVVPLFPNARAFETWPQGRSLLLGSAPFEAAMGFAPDRRIPVAFGKGAGRITLRMSDPTQPASQTLSTEVVEFGRYPEAGRALVRSGGTLVPTGSPTPATFDGSTHTLPPACFVQVGVPDAVRLSGMMLSCADENTDAQFVQIERTSFLAGRASDLRLRVSDRTGRSLGERDQLFPSGATFWGDANSLVIGGVAFLSTFGFAPDAGLPAVLDTEGGTIQLVRAESGVDRVISELRYGPGGVAPPAPASAIVLDQGTWRTDSLPRARGFHGSGVVSNFCRLMCDQQRIKLSLTTPQIVTPPAANYSDTYSSVSYNLSRAEFDVRSRFAHVELLTTDKYQLTGAVAPETLQTFLDVLESHRDSCSRNACFRASRRLHLIVNDELADTLLASVSERGRLSARVPFQPGLATIIQVFASADGLITPPLLGRVAGRLSFEPPPDGTRLVSCGGYDWDRARIVHEAEWSLGPHTVAIDWNVTADAGFTADVERLDESDPSGAWRLRETRPAESGLLRFRDTKLRAENAYRYRLTWSDAFGSYTSDEIRIQVPRLPSFGLVGALPNPSHGNLRLAFELAEPSDVRIELFDLHGRRVRDVRTSLSAGMQEVAVDQGRRLVPGLYQLRLGAGGYRAKLTVVVVP